MNSIASPSYGYSSPLAGFHAMRESPVALKTREEKPVEPAESVNSGNISSRNREPLGEVMSPESNDNADGGVEADAQLDKNKAAQAVEQRQLEQDQQEIAQLAARDREVRAHEQAHMAAGGQYAGSASYQYQRGPDGVNYAVGGEVPIDVGREVTPQATIAKMQIVKRAALAPAEPSSQDRKVAAQASQIEAQARVELRQEPQTENIDKAQTVAKTDGAATDRTETDRTAIDRTDVINQDTNIAPGIDRYDRTSGLAAQLHASIANTNPSLISSRPSTFSQYA